MSSYSLVGGLPSEIWQLILGQCSTKTLVSVARTCNDLRKLVKEVEGRRIQRWRNLLNTISMTAELSTYYQSDRKTIERTVCESDDEEEDCQTKTGAHENERPLDKLQLSHFGFGYRGYYQRDWRVQGRPRYSFDESGEPRWLHLVDKSGKTIVFHDTNLNMGQDFETDYGTVVMAFPVSLSREKCHLRCPHLLRLMIESEPHKLPLAQWKEAPVPAISLQFGCSTCPGESMNIATATYHTSSVENYQMDDPHDSVTPILADSIKEALALELEKQANNAAQADKTLV